MTKNITFQLTAMLLLLASCSPTTTDQPTLADYELGEKWVWKWSRSVEGEVRAEGEDLQEVIGINDDLYFAYHYDTIQISTVLNETQSDTPFRDWPMYVGKIWKYESEWTNEGGYQGKTSQNVEIISFGEVATRAGNFEAYQIKYQGIIENFTTGGKGNVTDTWWYCPALKTYIKHVQDDGYGLYTSELIHYSKGE